MSTFNGLVAEFPDIRVDYFRTIPGRSAPLACFLSHVHSDHLLGLDSLRAPFIYCSPATREMLLRLEKFPHRMNFNKGIAEAIPKHYRHLKRLLKPIPLECPTLIELSPGKHITVTLFNANHCLGAVAFLFEDEHNAALCTGDIRAEQWLLDSWARHPKFLPYVPSPQGPGLRRLSTIYLDTTFIVTSHMYAAFPSKAQGLSELYKALQKYPQSTIFYLHAWTFGYEDVWLALSQGLGSQIHLDRYRHRVYTSIGNSFGAELQSREASVLCGVKLGNTDRAGILTRKEGVRIHSCEKGSGCSVINGRNPIVRIKPIVARINDTAIDEVGLGDGNGDLDETHELDIRDKQAVAQLKSLCEQRIHDPHQSALAVALLEQHVTSGKTTLSLSPDLVMEAIAHSDDDLKLDDVVSILARAATSAEDKQNTSTSSEIRSIDDNTELPLEISFPYSRHSSYGELRKLVSLFQPKNVYPCTVRHPQNFTDEQAMETLFGDCCDAKGFIKNQNGPAEFTWDADTRAIHAELEKAGLVQPTANADLQEEARQETQMTDAGHTTDEDEFSQRAAPASEQAIIDLTSSPEPADSSSPRSSMETSSSLGERLYARRKAEEAAQAGEWYRVRMETTGREVPDVLGRTL